MSKEKDALNGFLQEAIEEDKREFKLRKMKLELDEEKTTARYEELKASRENLEKVKNLKIDYMSDEQIELLRRDNKEYMEAAQHSMMFIHPVFNGVVSFFMKNLILVLGETGKGKSTAVANIVFTNMTQKNPITGKFRRTLVLTNEENPSDFINKVTCLMKGWNYTNHSDFTAEQKEVMDTYMYHLPKAGLINVIGDEYEGTTGNTSTIEGMSALFDRLLEYARKGIFYDCILIDYYQNVNQSVKDPTAKDHEVQHKFTLLLDRFKNIYPAPIVVMCQLKPSDKDNKAPYTERIMGRKSIATKATVVLELESEPKEMRTKWTLHKGRYVTNLGQTFYTGFYLGKIVEYGADFIRKAAEWKAKMAFKKQAKDIFQENKEKIDALKEKK